MRVALFAGPTLHAARSPAIDLGDSVRLLPPAKCEDVLRAVAAGRASSRSSTATSNTSSRSGTKRSCGLSRVGCTSFGAASMGALRAAELEAFGMVGIGRVFASFRDGTLEDDDEVAVVHGSLEQGYVPLSEPMVNIRATLLSALADPVEELRARESALSRPFELRYTELLHELLRRELPPSRT